MKFLTKNDTVNSEEFNLRKEEYKSLAKQIDEYQKKRFTEWQENIMQNATDNLKQKILIKEPRENKYRINFSE